MNELLQFMDTDISGRIELGELMTNMAVQVRTGWDGLGRDRLDRKEQYRLGKEVSNRKGNDWAEQNKTGQDRT